MKIKSVLITGVGGLIGSNLADWILNNTDYTVIGIDDLSGGYLTSIHPSVQFHLQDAGSDLSYIFRTYDVEYVFHLAAYAAEGLSPFIRKFNYHNNLIVTANVVNHCINFNVKRLIFTSSMAVYGIQKVPYLEGMIPTPIDPYGVAKLACEMDIRIAGEQHGLDWCILRPHNVYGPNQNIWDRYRNVLGIWMRQHLNGEPLTIFGDGTQRRAFSYIDDCLDIFWKCAVSPNASKQIFNIGSDTEWKILDAAELLIDVMGSGKLEFHESRHEVIDAFSHHGKIQQALGYRDSTNLRTGLGKMWNWAKNQSTQKIKSWENLEIERNFINLWKNN
jgi:UDP-glucose 4-epimerase